MTTALIFVALGLILLTFGGDYLVRSALALAKHLKVSAFLAGVIVVGFGTSAPELLVSLHAALGGRPEMAMGNVIGSNIANVLLILGVSTCFAPILCSGKAVKRDALACIGASILILALAYTGTISQLAGAGLVIIFVIYLGMAARADKKANYADTADQTITDDWPLAKAVIIGLLSAVSLSIGAELLVQGASAIGRAIGISDRVIGLTLVAVGTSLPELAAAVIAASRRQTDLIIGNVFGSTLFNIFSILGITAMVTPLPITHHMISTDIPVSIAALMAVTVMIHLTTALSKRFGAILVALYSVYIVSLFA